MAASAAARSLEHVQQLLHAGRLDLPLPGGGASEARLAALAGLGATDLVVARLAEAHTDALAILAELAAPAHPAEARLLWGVWAADPPGAALTAEPSGEGWSLSGGKPWCSGATTCRRALVTAHAEDGYRLFALDPRHPGVRVRESTWVGPGMAGSDTRAVDLHAVPARAVGGPGDYLDRRGFWWGAAGVAAVWLGGARRAAVPLRRAAARHRGDLLLAAVGRVDAAQHAAWCSLRQLARDADADPGTTPAATRVAAARLAAARARAAVETAVEVTLLETARGTGPAPLATDAAHARHVADLQVYVRQSHGDRDLAALGGLVLDDPGLDPAGAP